MALSHRVLTEAPQSPAHYILQLPSVSFDFCGHFLPYFKDTKNTEIAQWPDLIVE